MHEQNRERKRHSVQISVICSTFWTNGYRLFIIVFLDCCTLDVCSSIWIWTNRTVMNQDSTSIGQSNRFCRWHWDMTMRMIFTVPRRWLYRSWSTTRNLGRNAIQFTPSFPCDIRWRPCVHSVIGIWTRIVATCCVPIDERLSGSIEGNRFWNKSVVVNADDDEGRNGNAIEA